MSSPSDFELLADFLAEAAAWMTADPLGLSPALIISAGRRGFEEFSRLDDKTKYAIFLYALRGSIRGAALRNGIQLCPEEVQAEIGKWFKQLPSEDCKNDDTGNKDG